MIKTKEKQCAGCLQFKPIWKSSGREKYCKSCWLMREPPKKIPSVSEKMRTVMDEYTKKRVAFVALHCNCQAKLPGCTLYTTDIHHKAGRGEHHNNISSWLAVCRSCHQWIEQHPEAAKELGYSENRLN